MTNVDREKMSSPRAKVHILVGPRSTVRVRILSTPLNNNISQLISHLEDAHDEKGSIHAKTTNRGRGHVADFI